MSERKGTKGGAGSAGGQSHLPPAPTPVMDASARIDKLVSLTYDSSPDVRRQAALELSRIDDPRAVFALLELGADKDPTVQELARTSLDHFKGEEKETLVSLEKIFEARQEGKPPPEDMAVAKKKLMPSLEKLFSKNKAARDRLMPSLEKLFSWIPTQPHLAGGQPSGVQSVTSVSAPTPPAPVVTPHHHSPTSRSSFEQVATAHITQAPPPSPPPSSDDDEDDYEHDDEDDPAHGGEAHLNSVQPSHNQFAPSHQSPPSASQQNAGPLDPLSGMATISHARPLSLEEIERQARDPVGASHSQQASAPSGTPSYFPARSPNASHSLSPSHSELEAAGDLPMPESVRDRLDAALSLPAMMENEQDVAEREEEAHLPKSRWDYYRWAYAIAIKPGVKASDLKKEEGRLIKDITSDIKTAFSMAVKRAKENGIESLSGLKPGMRKLTTLPLHVLAVSHSEVPLGKTKTVTLARVVLSDGQKDLPLYVPPVRAEGLRVGDLVSLRGAYVDYFVHSNETVLLLDKKGALIITK